MALIISGNIEEPKKSAKADAIAESDSALKQTSEIEIFPTSTNEEIKYNTNNLSVQDNELLNAINEAQIDCEQYAIEKLEEELEEAKNQLEEQDKNDGFINEIFNGFKELTGISISKSEVKDAIENQEIALKKLKEAKNTNDFKAIYEEITGQKYDKNKLLQCHQKEEELDSIKENMEKILQSKESNEVKQEKINTYLSNYQNEKGISYEQIANDYKELSDTYLSSANELTNILNQYADSQENFIDKTANVAQIGGMGLIIAGGIACFIPGGQIIGAGMLKGGQILAMAGTFGDNTADLIDTMTNQNTLKEDKEKYKEIGKETFTDAALFAAGYAAGSAASKIGGVVLEKTGSTILSKGADIATDASLSLLGDAAITGEVDIKGEGLSQLIGVLTGSATAKLNDIKINTPDTQTPKRRFNPETGELEAIKIKNDAEIIELDHEVRGDNTSSNLKFKAPEEFHNDKLTQTENKEFSLTANKLEKEYTEHIQEIAQETKTRFANLETVKQENITARPKSAKSIFEKLTSKYSKNKIPSADYEISKGAIGDAYGTRLQMNNVQNDVAEAEVAKALSGTDITQEQFNDYLIGKLKLEGDAKVEMDCIRDEVLNALKTKQAQEVTERLVSIIKNADPDGPRIITELNNYGSEISSYFTTDQIKLIASEYYDKYGEALTVVTKINPADFPDSNWEITDNKTFNIKTEEATYTNKGAQKDSGYTSTQMNTQHLLSNGTIGNGELQIRGTEVNAFADVEHIPYDIRQDKIKADDPKYSEIYDLIKNMNIETSYKKYNEYLSATYDMLRLKELGFKIEENDMPKIEDFLGEFNYTDKQLALLSKDGLEKLH